jgi:Kef-type K+ transport system membrane component KefB
MKKIGIAFRGIAFRSTLGVLVGLVAYFFFLAVGAGLLLDIPMGSAMGILIAISPVIPVAFVLYSVIQLLKHSDELQQRLQLFAISFSAVTTCLLTFAYGLLEASGYPIRLDQSLHLLLQENPILSETTGIPQINSAFILPLMVFLWVIGMLYFKWRYK